MVGGYWSLSAGLLSGSGRTATASEDDAAGRRRHRATAQRGSGFPCLIEDARAIRAAVVSLSSNYAHGCR